MKQRLAVVVLALGVLAPSSRAEMVHSSSATNPVIKRSSSAIATTVGGSTVIVVNPECGDCIGFGEEPVGCCSC